MANLANLIASDVAALQNNELQLITRQLDKARDENVTLKLINEELKKLLDQKNKLLSEKDNLLGEKDKEIDELRGKLLSAEKRLNEIDNFDLVCLLD